jgi:hypothetical protein
VSRPLTLVASWLAATCAATLLVASGVGTIRDATRRDAALVAPPASSTVGLGGVGGVSSSSTSVTSNVSPAPPTTVATIVATTVASATATPTTAASATTRPASPPTDGTGVSVTATPPPSTAPPPATTLATASTTITIVSSGGSATVRYSAEAVVVVVATPNAGFTTRVDQRGATAIRVEFESGSRRSRIEAWWDDGSRQDVREG